uniref:ABC transporter domain-containing protein n=1 Tax=Daucus carota subsp. sativus TaxID=79200 RepID=A0A161ZXM9_DAUCS
MTLFLRTELDHDTITDGTLYMGSFFFGVVLMMFNGMAELAMTIAKLPVFYKQRDLLFFPTWSYSLPVWIVKIPSSILEAAVWTCLTYYVIGYDPNVGRFVKQFVLNFLINQMASGLFRLMAALGRNMILAMNFGGFAVLILFALGGFVLARDDVAKMWIWGYYTSPIMYAMNAITVNEFLGHQWSKLTPNSTETVGVAVLKSRGFFPYSYWYWIGAGALIGFTLIFNFLVTMALSYMDPLGKPQPLIPDEDDTNEATELSTREINVEASQSKKKGMVLPFEPYAITFDDVKYSVDMPQEMKEQGVGEDKLLLLKSVSGAFRPGVLTALMGVSGAGKTTLMDVLAGRKTGGYIEGNITISGFPKKQETFARIAGYCEQNDIHSPHVTLYESLLYSAWLRLPTEITANTRKMFVDEVLELVEINNIRNALVGLPGVNGLSIEQRKRLTIAVELVANPSIIFMDEPTSGLDARAAAIVMRTVRNTVDTGRTVVCTIHQPSIDIFEAFDELFLLKRGGREIYVGPVGRQSCELIKYFEDIDGISKIKDGYNPATWMLEVTSPAQEMALGIDFTEVYRNSDLFRRNKALIAELSVPPPGAKDLYFPSQYSQTFINQCLACLWKQRCSYWRNTAYIAVRLIFATVAGLSLGSMFWDLGSKMRTRLDLFNAMGSMYAACLFLGVQNSASAQPVVDVERTVFYRERAAGMYSAVAYAFAQVLVEVPYVLSQTLIYCLIVYSMIGFDWTVAKFCWYLFFTFFTLLYFAYFGMMTVAVTPNADIAAVIAAAFYGLWNLFSGFIMPRPCTEIQISLGRFGSDKRNKALIAELSVPPPGAKDLYFPSQYSQTFINQCLACLWKQRCSYWRNTAYIAVRLIFATVAGLSLGSMFWDLGSKMRTRLDLFNAMGSMYAACLFLGVQNSASAQPVVDVERTVFYRERAAGMYSAVAYAFAQVLVEVPYVLSQTLIYCLIVYSMIGFDWTVAKFCWYLFFTFFTLLYFAYFGMMTVAVTPNADIAAVIAAAFYGLWNLFSGFIMPRPAMPDWWKWFSWICPVAWTLYGLIGSQFGDIDDKILEDVHQNVKDFVDDYFGFKHDHVGLAAFAVVTVAVLFALVFAVSVKSLNFQKR